jgi:hypothetical protein
LRWDLKNFFAWPGLKPQSSWSQPPAASLTDVSLQSPA